MIFYKKRKQKKIELMSRPVDIVSMPDAVDVGDGFCLQKRFSLAVREKQFGDGVHAVFELKVPHEGACRVSVVMESHGTEVGQKLACRRVGEFVTSVGRGSDVVLEERTVDLPASEPHQAISGRRGVPFCNAKGGWHTKPTT